MSFGDRLREQRLKRLLSQEELAEALGVSRRTITRWEQNLALPRSFAQQQLCHFLGLSQEEFLKVLEASVPPPLLWTVPFARNPFFTGREEILHLLHGQLTMEQPMAPPRALALSGLGGVGKTQLAIEYAHRYASEYQAVFWLAAETAESLVASWQQIAAQLQLPQRLAMEQAQMVKAVQRWLASQHNWLLIADNVEELDLLEEVFPTRREGSLLLTTRRQALGGLAEVVEVPALSQQESISLLLARSRLARETGEGAASQEALSLEMPTITGITELVKLLEGLPLAVDQAGAYIEETGCRVADYLSRYQSQRKQILARRGMHAIGHPASVSTTLRLSVQRIGRQYPVADDLLHLCALLHPEAIPEELFSVGASHLGAPLESLVADPYQFDLILAALRSASLMTRSPQTKTLTLHRLVQAVLVDQMKPAERRLWSERAVRLVNAAFPAGEYDQEFVTWESCERVLPQVLACIPLLEAAEGVLSEAGELFSKAGDYLVQRGRYREAEDLLEQALALAEQQLDPEPSVLCNRLEKRAELFWKQGRHTEAEVLLQRELQVAEQRLGPDHLETAATLNNLALLSWGQGKYQEAEPLYQRALSIRQQQLGSAHLQTASTLINLALLHWSQGKYDAAEALYFRALRIQEQHLESEHPSIANTLNNLAATYSSQGKYQQAEYLYSRALRIQEHHLGSEHPSTTNTLSNLANIYRKQGKYEQARPLYFRARHLREQQLGPDHPDIAYTLTGLAITYGKLGDAQEAERLFVQALRVREHHLGPTHPLVAETLVGLANVYRDRGKDEQAEPLYQRALDMREHLLGPTHLDTAFTLHEMANLYRDQGKNKQAEPLYQRAQAIYEQYLGSDHPTTIKILHDRDRSGSS